MAAKGDIVDTILFDEGDDEDDSEKRTSMEDVYADIYDEVILDGTTSAPVGGASKESPSSPSRENRPRQHNRTESKDTATSTAPSSVEGGSKESAAPNQRREDDPARERWRERSTGSTSDEARGEDARGQSRDDRSRGGRDWKREEWERQNRGLQRLAGGARAAGGRDSGPWRPPPGEWRDRGPMADRRDDYRRDGRGRGAGGGRDGWRERAGGWEERGRRDWPGPSGGGGWEGRGGGGWEERARGDRGGAGWGRGEAGWSDRPRGGPWEERRRDAYDDRGREEWGARTAGAWDDRGRRDWDGRGGAAWHDRGTAPRDDRESHIRRGAPDDRRRGPTDDRRARAPEDEHWDGRNRREPQARPADPKLAAEQDRRREVGGSGGRETRVAYRGTPERGSPRSRDPVVPGERADGGRRNPRGYEDAGRHGTGRYGGERENDGRDGAREMRDDRVGRDERVNVRLDGSRQVLRGAENAKVDDGVILKVAEPIVPKLGMEFRSGDEAAKVDDEMAVEETAAKEGSSEVSEQGVKVVVEVQNEKKPAQRESVFKVKLSDDQRKVKEDRTPDADVTSDENKSSSGDATFRITIGDRVAQRRAVVSEAPRGDSKAGAKRGRDGAVGAKEEPAKRRKMAEGADAGAAAVAPPVKKGGKRYLLLAGDKKRVTAVAKTKAWFVPKEFVEALKEAGKVNLCAVLYAPHSKELLGFATAEARVQRNRGELVLSNWNQDRRAPLAPILEVARNVGSLRLENLSWLEHDVGVVLTEYLRQIA